MKQHYVFDQIYHVSKNRAEVANHYANEPGHDFLAQKAHVKVIL